MQAQNYKSIVVFAPDEIPYTSSDEQVEEKITKIYSMSVILITADNETLDVSDNLIYFRYSYMHSWFGPFIAASFIFDDPFTNEKQNIIAEHKYIKVIFNDNCGSIELKFRKNYSTPLTSEIPASTEGISMNTFTAIYYPEILFQLALKPTEEDIRHLKCNIMSLKTLLDKYGVSVQETSYFKNGVESIDSKIPQISTLSEATIAVLNMQRNTKKFALSTANITLSGRKDLLEHAKSYATHLDASHIFPYRVGTNATGDTLFFTHFFEPNVNDPFKYIFLGSLTDDVVEYRSVKEHLKNYSKIIISNKRTSYKLNSDFYKYIRNNNNTNLKIQISHNGRVFDYVIRLRDILEAQGYNNIPFTASSKDKPFTLTYSCDYPSRQRLAVDLLNNIHFAAVIQFDCTTLVPITDLFRYNSGNIMWSFFTYGHTAITNKFKQSQNVEFISFPYRLIGFVMEIKMHKSFARRICTQQLLFSAPFLISVPH
jgi:hypothetical protein